MKLLAQQVLIGIGEIQREKSLLTVFVKMKNHHQGIGKKLIQDIEKTAVNMGCNELVIPASAYACEFYRKLGFNYIDDKKIQNEDKGYILVKKY